MWQEQHLRQNNFSGKLQFNFNMTKNETIKQEEIIKEASTNTKDNKTMNAQLVSLDIPFFIKNILKEKSWKKKEHNSISIYKSNGLSIVLVALKKGTEISKHTADGIIAAQVFKGKIIFKTEYNSVELRKGQMIALHSGIPHSVVAKKKTIFLLTLSTQKTN